MMLKNLFIIIIITCFPFYIFAQSISKIKTEDVLTMIDTSHVPLVINFWATWCKPCVDELPILEKEAEAYKDEGLKLVLVSLDFHQDYPANLEAFVKKHNYQSQIFWLDENNILDFCRKIDSKWTAGIPATIMVNNAKHYREFYYYGMVQYQAEAYFKDLTQ